MGVVVLGWVVEEQVEVCSELVAWVSMVKKRRVLGSTSLSLLSI